jgi:hypothetical protein
MRMSQSSTASKSNESPFVDLIFNLLIPFMILKKADEWLGLDPVLAFVFALAFPLGIGVKDFFVKKKVNIFSVLGFVNVLLTGGIGLLALSPFWVAVKEASIPLVLGLAIVISMWTPYPLVKTVLYNDKILKVGEIDAALEERKSKSAFEGTLRTATWWLAGAFLVSATLNYVLARIMVKTHPSENMAQFNDEIGSMWIWSIVVIAIPSTCVMIFALWSIIRGIKKHAGLTFEQVMVGMEESSPSTDPK